jgi:very-short-patch-repair endonuclease
MWPPRPRPLPQGEGLRHKAIGRREYFTLLKTLIYVNPRVTLARLLRHNQTLAERKLWWILRSRALEGYKFYRQHPIGPYFVDFCCHKGKVVIELDGYHHLNTQEYDDYRTEYLLACGYQVIRFWNREVITQEKLVVEKILHTLKLSKAVGLLPPGEGGTDGS